MAINNYSIKIDGIEFSNKIKNKSVSIEDADGWSPSQMKFTWEGAKTDTPPSKNQEIIVVDATGERIFGGYIIKAKKTQKKGYYKTSCTCLDYQRVLDRNLVTEGYLNKTDKQIFSDIVQNYCQGEEFSVDGVVEDVTISDVRFNYDLPSKCFTKIAKNAHKTWYVDYYKKIHYHSITEFQAPFNINDSTSNKWRDLEVNEDDTNIRNRVYVRGGSKNSDLTTYRVSADGEQDFWILPYKPSELSMTVGGITKTIGIANIDDEADFDYLLNFQEKTVFLASDTKPTSGTSMQFTFRYQIPVLVAVEDRSSIEEVGQFEHAIFDKSIKTTELARERASAEITDYGNSIVDASFKTLENGFMAGQYLNLNAMGVNEDYVVQKVKRKSLGNGLFESTISVASAQKIGIINFLIGLLESNKNTLDLSSDEVVDELFTIEPDQMTVSETSPSFTSRNPTTSPYLWNSSDWSLFSWQ